MYGLTKQEWNELNNGDKEIVKAEWEMEFGDWAILDGAEAEAEDPQYHHHFGGRAPYRATTNLTVEDEQDFYF